MMNLKLTLEIEGTKYGAEFVVDPTDLGETDFDLIVCNTIAHYIDTLDGRALKPEPQYLAGFHGTGVTARG